MPDLVRVAAEATQEYSATAVLEASSSPLIILSAPRAGSTLLFESLRRVDALWSIGGESLSVYRAFPNLHAENASIDSGRLTDRHADTTTADHYRRCCLYLMRDARGVPWIRTPAQQRPAPVDWVEKTPRNALNVGFLESVFPNARYVFLYRSARPSIASLVEAWTLGLQTGRFVTYRDLPGWDRPGWCFLLPPGWRELIGQSLFDIAAFQWASSNQSILESLQQLAPGRYRTLSYETFLRDADECLASICQFAKVPPPQPGIDLPVSGTTISRPDANKWRAVQTEIADVEQRFAATEEALANFVECL